MTNSPVSVVMYTRGTGSGHIARINAVYRGFRRAKLPVTFHASAYRSKYLSLLDPGIRRLRREDFPERCDIFICDWSADAFVLGLPRSCARLWVGLKRLGTIPDEFPNYFHVVGIEPNVAADIIIWPIISTWHDDQLSRDEIQNLLNVNDARAIYLLCENGAYPKHLKPVFTFPLQHDGHLFRCSNSPFAGEIADIYYYPIARLFGGIDGLVLGGGYNSVHEALSHAKLEHTTFVRVGGDDQARRMRLSLNWEHGRDSASHELARHLYKLIHD